MGINEKKARFKMIGSNNGRGGIFLDRDGVINRNILNPQTGEFESPAAVGNLSFFPGVAEALRGMRSLGFFLILISNQPSHAKGKATMAELDAVGDAVKRTLDDWGVPLDGYYYCYHHPKGITPGFSKHCECRKPGTLFVDEACRRFELSIGRSWIIGDRETDILCGKAAGLKTILILDPTSADRRGDTDPDYSAPTLLDAVDVIRRNIV